MGGTAVGPQCGRGKVEESTGLTASGASESPYIPHAGPEQNEQIGLGANEGSVAIFLKEIFTPPLQSIGWRQRSFTFPIPTAKASVMITFEPLLPLTAQEEGRDTVVRLFIDCWKLAPGKITMFNLPPPVVQHILKTLAPCTRDFQFRKDSDGVSINTETLSLLDVPNFPRTSVAANLMHIMLGIMGSTRMFREVIRLGMLECPFEFQIVRYRGSKALPSYIAPHSDASGDPGRVATLILCLHKSDDIKGGDVIFDHLNMEDVTGDDDLSHHAMSPEGCVVSQSVGTVVVFWSRRPDGIIKETSHTVDPILSGSEHPVYGHKSVIVIFWRITRGYAKYVSEALKQPVL